jgi:hypothetical protein
MTFAFTLAFSIFAATFVAFSIFAVTLAALAFPLLGKRFFLAPTVLDQGSIPIGIFASPRTLALFPAVVCFTTGNATVLCFREALMSEQT